jgi:hypothetical protein
VHGIPVIVTWNTRHMRSLFPGLAISTPKGEGWWFRSLQNGHKTRAIVSRETFRLSFQPGD